MVTQFPIGTSPTHEQIDAYELKCDDYAVRVMNFGATILKIIAPDAHGIPADIVLGFDRTEDYFDNPACFGATIGPSANRSNKAEVVVDGKTYQLPKNEGPNNRNNLHTDLNSGLHKRVWDTELDEENNSVIFSLDLADGVFGLPGNRHFTVRYTFTEIEDGAELKCTHTVTTDTPTFVNMSNHAYFNLRGATQPGGGEATVQLKAHLYIPLREDSVSRGDIAPVAGTPFDFTQPKSLLKDINADDPQLKIAHGYDHCFVIDGWKAGAAPRPALHAKDTRSGRTLDMLLTAPGAHLYTGNWLGDKDAKGGVDYHPQSGFAFEAEYYPDCSHHPDWPQPICKPGCPYSEQIIWRLGHTTQA